MTPPAGWPHGSIEATLVRHLGNHVAERNLGRVLGSSQGFQLPSEDVVEPDVSFVSAARWSGMAVKPERGKFLQVVPDLVIEVLSPGNASRDRGEKRGIYQSNGVLEYWLLDADSRRAQVLVLEGTRYRDAALVDVDAGAGAGAGVDGEGRIESVVLPGFAVSLADLFE